MPERPFVWLALSAPAKINLVLRVLGKRPDGYHELETLFHALSLRDLLLGRPVPEGFALRVESRCATGLPVPDSPDNLVLRAARRFHEVTGVAGGAHFVLRKRIPAGGGLGGGSSDAAAALRILQAWHGDPLTEARLAALARELGADVPFFLRGGTQLGLGVGEALTEVPAFPPLALLLILPPFGTSTAAVYKNCGAELTMAPDPCRNPDSKVPAYQALAVPEDLMNDLEAPAFALHHELRELREMVAHLDANVRMSGSGSSLFLARPVAMAVELDRAQSELRKLRQHGVFLMRCHSQRVPARERPRPVRLSFDSCSAPSVVGNRNWARAQEPPNHA